MKLLIADDEKDVREGIRYLLDWSDLGFHICGEGKNGQDTLDQLMKLCPDIVLLDIRMPKLTGLEVVKQAKKQGFQGKFIIVSGYSDFSYAKTAIQYGVNSYLTKPIDEDELEEAILRAKEELLSEQEKQKKMIAYLEKARTTILKDILLGTANYPMLDYNELLLDTDVFQVLIYTSYNQTSFQATWDFASILRLANHQKNSLEHIQLDVLDVILLKGSFALSRFQELVTHYISHPQKGSPLDSLFLVYGRPVYRVEEITRSFDDVKTLMKRRFFCRYNQHVLGYEHLPSQPSMTPNITVLDNVYSERISNYIQSGNRLMVAQVLEELNQELYSLTLDIPTLKHHLADIIIQVKSILSHTYSTIELPFASNPIIISTIEETYYLYEILQFFNQQFDQCMNVLGSPTRDSVMDGVLLYIRHNYQENLKLGTIAELFGYNSSYLGKVFCKTTGKNFNAYVDEVRIEVSKSLLLEEDYKVYKIAELVGYTNVDYFHKKFKKYVGVSPVEYRKQ